MDIKKLTTGELAWLEEYTGRSISTFTDADRPQTKLIIGIVYLFDKRADQSITVDHIEALSLEQLTERLNALQEADTALRNYAGEVVHPGES